MQLRNKLAAKREQVASLRTVLKKNKSVAETALANLKQKYENEKAIVTDTLRALRGELKMLKEDAFTYTSIRAMFTEKHEEFVQQMDQLQQKLNVRPPSFHFPLPCLSKNFGAGIWISVPSTNPSLFPVFINLSDTSTSIQQDLKIYLNAWTN